MSGHPLPKKLAIFGIVLPIAIIGGYFLATPDSLGSLAVFGMLFGVMCLPILLRWHHLILIFSWNAAIIVFFLPGRPSLWMLMALASALITLTGSFLNKDFKFQKVPPVTLALLAFAAVIVVTALVRGGVGIRSLGGSSYGGKRYVELLLAIVGYFAICWQRIPAASAGKYVASYYLSGLTPIISHLAFYAGPSFYFLFYFFEVGFAEHQYMAELLDSEISRLTGFSFAGLACASYLLARFGVRGLLDVARPWRMGLLVAAVALGMFGGFRSVVLQISLTCGLLFFFEKLHRTRLVTPVLVGLAMTTVGLFLFSSRMPLSFQRSLSFLPLEISPIARMDAEASSMWRMEMWRMALPEVPQYLWVGKGYSLNPTDLYLMEQSRLRGWVRDYEPSLAVGDYHNGPLSILIPFGLFGMLAFLGFLFVAWRLLYANYRYSSPELKTLNTFLVATFVMRVIWFFFLFGGISTDLMYFTGLVGLSVSLNGGMLRKPAVQPAAEKLPAIGGVAMSPV